MYFCANFGYQKSIDGYQKNLDKAEQKKKEANDNIQSTNAKIEASEQLIKDYARDINPENSGDVIEKASKARDTLLRSSREGNQACPLLRGLQGVSDDIGYTILPLRSSVPP